MNSSICRQSYVSMGACKGRQVMGKLERVMKERCVSMEVKRGIGNSVILPTLSYTSETWTWNAAQQSRMRSMEMSYMRP